MQTYLAILLTLVLTSCENEGISTQVLTAKITAIQEETQHLREQLANHQALVEYNEKQAGIAAGCDWLIPICPVTITEAGHRAQTDGYSGADSMKFWLIFIAKLTAAGAFMSALVGGVWWLRIRIIHPKEAAVTAAQQLVSKATQMATAARQRATEQNELLQRLAHECEEANVKLTETQRQVAQAENGLENIKTARAALDALSLR